MIEDNESVFTSDELGEDEPIDDEFDDEIDSENLSSSTQYSSELDDDSNDNDDEVAEAEGDIHLVPIPLTEIDRKSIWQMTDLTDPSNFKDADGIPMPHLRLISSGSLPMISPHQSEENLKDPKFRIFNKSALEYYSDDIVKLYQLAEYFGQEAQQKKKQQIYELEEEREAPNEKVVKILQSLGEVVERFRDNLTNLYDPPMEGTRKQRRLTRKKTALFKLNGYKQMITVIEQYIKGLKTYGEYPEEMWEEFEKAKEQALNAKEDDGAILYGSQILVCADFVLGDEPEVRVTKRINEGIAQPSSQE